MKYIKKGIAPLFFVSTLVLAGNCSAPENKISNEITTVTNVIVGQITDIVNTAIKKITDARDTTTVDTIVSYASDDINHLIQFTTNAASITETGTAADAAAGRAVANTIITAAKDGIITIKDAAEAAKTKLR